MSSARSRLPGYARALVNDRLLAAAEVGDLFGLTAGTILDRFEAGDLPGFRLFPKTDRRGRPPVGAVPAFGDRGGVGGVAGQRPPAATGDGSGGIPAHAKERVAAPSRH